MSGFADSIRQFEEKLQKRALFVHRAAAQDVAEDMVLTSEEGGTMRVDTGFLRASQVASLDAMPRINPQSKPPENTPKNFFASKLDDVNLVIAGANIEDTIYIGFTASYARPREYKDGFVRLATLRWDGMAYRRALESMTVYP